MTVSVTKFNRLGQLADGVDQFYVDASNRLILTVDAAWVVLNKIRGLSQADIEMMTLELRKAAR